MAAVVLVIVSTAGGSCGFSPFCCSAFYRAGLAVRCLEPSGFQTLAVALLAHGVGGCGAQGRGGRDRAMAGLQAEKAQEIGSVLRFWIITCELAGLQAEKAQGQFAADFEAFQLTLCI
jgi:hypothetical protein